jgi:VanZ family protein
MNLSKLKFRRETLWPFVLAGTITWCSGHAATLPEAGGLPVDKIGHFGLYGALATAFIRVPALARWPGLGAWWALVLASAYGMGDEYRQSFTHGIRSADWHDWLADTIGAIVAVSLYIRWPWYRRLMETPIFRRRKATEEVTSNKDQVPRGSGEVPSDK